MGKVKQIDGDLIKLAKQGEFDVIAHGCNCFCTMGAGIAPQMAKAFHADKFRKEHSLYKGDMNKLGTIDYCGVRLIHDPDDAQRFLGKFNSQYVEEFEKNEKVLYVVNAYTQYGFGRNHEGGLDRPLDYAALNLCLKKMNHEFKGKRIGLPWIGCGLAGGDKGLVLNIIETNFTDCDVTIVNYKP